LVACGAAILVEHVIEAHFLSIFFFCMKRSQCLLVGLTVIRSHQVRKRRRVIGEEDECTDGGHSDDDASGSDPDTTEEEIADITIKWFMEPFLEQTIFGCYV
jgi:hypothetical protein